MAFHIPPDQVLAGRRLALVEILRAQPGLCFQAIVRASGLAGGTTAHHLRILERHELAWSISHGPRRRFFAGKRPSDEVAGRLARQAGVDAAMATILDYVRAHPMCAQLDVIAAFPSKPYSTVQHVLGRLVREQFVTRMFFGRYVRYRAIENAPPTVGPNAAGRPVLTHAWTHGRGVPA